MLFSLTNPEVAIMMMGIFLFAVLLGFPIAFTLMAMGLGFGSVSYTHLRAPRDRTRSRMPSSA